MIILKNRILFLTDLLDLAAAKNLNDLQDSVNSLNFCRVQLRKNPVLFLNAAVADLGAQGMHAPSQT